MAYLRINVNQSINPVDKNIFPSGSVHADQVGVVGNLISSIFQPFLFGCASLPVSSLLCHVC
jgi:hypothetical protein